MRELVSVRLVDVPATEDRQRYGNFGTSFFAGKHCKMWRDELGWVHVALSLEVEGNVIPRDNVLCVPPQMVKWVEYPAKSQELEIDLRWKEIPLNDEAYRLRSLEPDGGLMPPPTQQPQLDPTYRHPKAKKK